MGAARPSSVARTGSKVKRFFPNAETSVEMGRRKQVSANKEADGEIRKGKRFFPNAETVGG
ncbi:hypothetical protein GsuE55_22400 [Geobacillus subterraneus]|uniref:Uncharacterized protein n=1 Tax=Geobacillus subterraneus TaxID=129338 RepID=A0A679FT20_9BACL|nr:hypothetical protein GsuE55_22400 [Geobacillus subterraneus]